MYGYDEYEDRPNRMFKRPTRRRATRGHAKTRPCPTCGIKNALTRADVNAGYKCTGCTERPQ